jgi:hypothetical protein
LQEIITHDSAEGYAEEFRVGEAYRRYCPQYTVHKLKHSVKSGDHLEIGAAHGVFSG